MLGLWISGERHERSQLPLTRQAGHLVLRPALELLFERVRLAGARLAWSNPSFAKPVAVSLVLDGNPVPLDGQAHAVLPAVDPGVTHVLSAEVRSGASAMKCFTTFTVGMS